MRFPLSHRRTLCVTPKSPKVCLKTRIFTFGVAFHIFVAGNCRHFIFGMYVEYRKSQSTHDKPSLNWAWSRHVTHFKFLLCHGGHSCLGLGLDLLLVVEVNHCC